MNTAISKTLVLTAGFAIFAMQFGAGNIVFALSIGQHAQDKNLHATFGLILSSVILPLIGLMATTLYQGDYNSFFARIGKFPGFFLTVLILALLGPLGAIPRCLVLAYSTSTIYFPNMSLPMYSLGCCIFIFFFTFRRTRILEYVGYFLTPLKLGSLLFLIVCGIYAASTMPISTHEGPAMFFKGFTDGYQTMDLLGAFFICSVILDGLKKNDENNGEQKPKEIIMAALKASCIGALLLALVYLGFSYIAALHSTQLEGVNPQDLIGKISLMVLGDFGGLFVCFAVTMACLTTAVALSSIFAEFLRKDICKEKISYPFALVITLIITYVISTLNFTGIMKMLAPVLFLFYPTLIALCVVNILHKLYNFKPVKIPILIVFAGSLVQYFLI